MLYENHGEYVLSLKSLAMLKFKGRNILHAVQCKWQPGAVLMFCSYYVKSD